MLNVGFLNVRLLSVGFLDVGLLHVGFLNVGSWILDLLVRASRVFSCQ